MPIDREDEGLRKALAGVIEWLEVPDYVKPSHTEAARAALKRAEDALATSPVASRECARCHHPADQHFAQIPERGEFGCWACDCGGWVPPVASREVEGHTKAEFERVVVGLIEATDLLRETINGYKVDQAAAWLKARGFLEDDEPAIETLAGFLEALIAEVEYPSVADPPVASRECPTLYKIDPVAGYVIRRQDGDHLRTVATISTVEQWQRFRAALDAGAGEVAAVRAIDRASRESE